MFKFLKKQLTPSSRALVVSKTFQVDYADYAATGERDAILASSGMGKSYLTGVLMEETLENGGLLCVIDPEGEHFTLAERYPMLIIGGDHGNIPMEEDAVELVIDAMLSAGLSAVFDLSEFLDNEQQHLYAVIADKLFNAEQKYRRKIRLVVEEAQIYAPQRMAGGPSGGRGAKKTMDPVLASQKIAKRGRKRAIDSLWATQRPASISKDILSQCNRFWFGGITSEQDYKAIKSFLTEAGISFTDIKALQPGQFYFYGKGHTEIIQVRKRICKHAGATPEAGMQFQATVNSSLDKALAQLTEAVAKRSAERKQEQSESTRLKQVIRELEEENRKLKQELMQEQLATKVIERLGSRPAESKLPSPGGASRRKLSAAERDTGEVAVAAGELRTFNPLALTEPPMPERIILD
jgi:5-bromo-4-chloroindolyl phosphate hydrolysis protein